MEGKGYEDKPMNNIKAYLEQVQKETEQAIKRGWDASRSDWRKMALITLLEVCLSHRTLSLNDFRERIMQSEIKTENYRALGGLMVTARKWGWIESIGTQPSLASHKSPIRMWQSKIYQEPSFREQLQSRQTSNALF